MFPVTRTSTVGENQRRRQKLGLEGGLKAVSGIKRRGRPKIGLDEFMSIAERFGFSSSVRRRMRSMLRKEDMGTGPFLANYYSGLKETRVQAFERTARKVFGSRYAIGVSSGTGALHAAFVAAGVGPGTEVILPAIGFFATASAVVICGGVPVFCDVDDSLSMDPAKIEKLVTPRTVAISPTHVMGSVCDMGAIMRVARRHRLKVVEDCAQSCGGEFRGRLVGTFGDLGCFSISSYKIVGGGEGGLLLTDKLRLWERASQLAECGGLWRPNRFAPPRYKGELFCGTNYRMSELEAAVDVVQLRKMKAAVNRFRRVKRRILDRLKKYRDITPQKLNDPDGEVGYLLRFYPETFQLGARIVTALEAQGIGCSMRGPHAGPDWHLYSYMYPVKLRGDAVNCNRGDCPVADDLFDRMITVSLNQWLSPRDCDSIARGINKVLSACCTEDPGATPWH